MPVLFVLEFIALQFFFSRQIWDDKVQALLWLWLRNHFITPKSLHLALAVLWSCPIFRLQSFWIICDWGLFSRSQRSFLEDSFLFVYYHISMQNGLSHPSFPAVQVEASDHWPHYSNPCLEGLIRFQVWYLFMSRASLCGGSSWWWGGLGFLNQSVCIYESGVELLLRK